MVISVINTCNVNKKSNGLNQNNIETSIHWRPSPETTSPEAEQQNCISNYNNHDENFNNNDQSFNSHDHRPSSPVQNGEENSYYGSENGVDNLSPRQENSRSSSGEDIGVNLFPISGCNSTTQCFDYSNSDNESSQTSPSSFHDDDSFRLAKGTNSSSSKAKVHKCRSCDFSTTDKYESWKHIETHLKPEKILRCPECPFVTEYKHHLDFHIWNHQGMKPYKCDKCAYHCVNKSMLKSHLKSHSNVYQYRCNDCTYRTKYCHSLKIHLRKYKHSPGVVLDADGNPNPNPVIDVYGNRRGPKQKPKKHDTVAAVASTTTTTAVAAVTAATALPLQPPIPALNAFQNLSWVNNVFFPENSRIPCPVLPNTATIISASSFMNETRITSQETDNLNNNLKITVNNNNNNNNSSRNNHKNINNNNSNINNLNCNINSSNNTKKNNSNSRCSNNNSLFLHNNNNHNNNVSSIHLDSVKRRSFSDDEDMFQPDTYLEEPPSTISPSTTFYLPFQRSTAHLTEMQVSVAEEAPLNLTISHVPAVPERVSTPVVKNRRKGVACKLKRTAVEEMDSYRHLLNNVSPMTATTDRVELSSATETANTIGNDQSTNELLAKLQNKKHYYCDFCEITFFNQIMFTMHMGYHGYTDPFTCNRCGKKTEDKIDFYAHMISSAH